MPKILNPFLLIVFLVGSFSLRAQNLDSLLRAASQAKPDTNKLKTLINIGEVLNYNGMFEEAREHLTEALELSKTLASRKGECMVQIRLGTSHFYQGNYAEALDTWEKGMVIAKDIKHTELQNNYRMNMANAYLSMGNFDESHKAYFEVLEWAEATNQPNLAAACLTNIVVLNAMQDKMDEAMRYQRRVLDEYASVLSPFDKANCLINLGQMQLEVSEVDEAAKTYAELLTFAQRNELGSAIADAHYGLGNVALVRKDRIGAKEHFQQAMNMHTEARALTGKAIVFANLGNLYREAVEEEDKAFLGRYFNNNASLALSAAHSSIDSAITIFIDVGELDQLRTAYHTISIVENAQGKFKEALAHFQLFHSLSDSLLNTERDKKITETAMQYEFDKKEAATQAEQEKKDQRQRLVRNGIGGGLAFAVLFLGVVWRQRNRINKEKKRSEELLLNILPEETAKELKEKGHADAQRIDQATILFTDFKGFTAVSENLTPEKLVADLHECFSAFDRFCDKYGIEKIKTIGDAYMAAGGLPTPNKTHAQDVVKVAFEMAQFVEHEKLKKIAAGLPYFEVRLGIHTGPVVAGIVGIKKFQYDIWGDTVNIASRMESSGEPGKVNVSQTTYELLKDHGDFTFEYRGKVAAKGKGELEMYFAEPT